MTTGQKIRLAREGKGITQKVLAHKIGLNPQAISQWELNLREPKLSTIIRIADALDTSFVYFLPDEIYDRLYDYFVEE